MLFRRPAFRHSLSIEHRDNFKQAISASLRALDTGVLIDRDGAIKRAAAHGYAGLSNDSLRSACRGLRDQLDAFNHTLLSAERARRVEQTDEWLNIGDIDLYHALSQMRADCVATLNSIITPLGLEPV